MTPNEQMANRLEVMAILLRENQTDSFRIIHNAFEQTRQGYAELMTDDELHNTFDAYGRAPLSLPCGVQDAIADARDTVRRELVRRKLL